MTQDVRVNKIIANMPQQVWPFCVGGCGTHQKTATFRVRTGDVRCDACVVRRRRPRPWRPR